MAKIRSFKPDFWTDSKLVQIPFEARLMFMGLWTYACDNGHVEDDPLQLKMRIFPADDVDVSHLLDILAGAGLIDRADGLVTVRNLGRHQHINKRYFTTCDHCNPPETPGSQRCTTLHNGGQEKKPVDGDGDGDCEVDGECDGDMSRSAATKGRKRPARPLPATWKPTDKHHAYADGRSLDLAYEADRFRNHALMHDRRLVSWDAAFTNWLGKAYPRPRAVGENTGGSFWDRTKQEPDDE